MWAFLRLQFCSWSGAVHADYYDNYQTLDEIVAASDVVVRGVVDEVLESRVVASGDGPPQSVTVVVRVIEVLSGDVESGDVVSYIRDGWELLADGKRDRNIVVNGLRVPDSGDEFVLFLSEMPDGSELENPNRSTHYVMTSDGLLQVSGDRMASELEDNSGGINPPLGVRLATMTYEELKLAVADSRP